MPIIDIPITSTVQTLTGDNGVTTDATFTTGGTLTDNGNDVRLNGSSFDSTTPALDVDFSAPVQDLQFTIEDVDQNGWDDQVRILAFAPDGTPIPITFTTTSPTHVIESDGSNGVLQIEGSNDLIDNNSLIVVTIPGPVGSVQIFYEDGETASNDTGFINVIDMSFTDAVAPGSDGTVSGTAGDDVIDGTYVGDPDGDIVDNNDAILPGDVGNDDLIEANGGNDTVFAADGDDEVYGGTGNDTIDGGVGDDTLFGGTGDDVFTIAEADNSDTIFGGENAGDTDTVDYSGATGPDGVDVTYDGDESADYLIGSGADGTFDEIEAVIGTDNADTIDATLDNAGIDVDTGAGNDVITGGQAADDITAGTGDDTIVLNDDFGDDIIDAGEDASGTDVDVLDGSALTQDVTLDLNASETGTITNGTDTASFDNVEEFILGSGDDTVLDDDNANIVNMGGGDDTFVVNDGFDRDTVVGGETGETTGDVIDGSALTEDVIVSMTGDEVGSFSTQTSLNRITFSEIERLVTGSGEDTVLGRLGDDHLTTNAGNDYINASGGNDTVFAGAGDDFIAGGLGNDTLTAGTGTDTIFGGAGVDELYGGGDDDLLVGGAGNDIQDGGAGDDIFELGDGFGVDNITGGETAEDLSDPTNGDQGDQIDASDMTTDVVLNFINPEDGTLTSGGNIATFVEIEDVHLGSGNDLVNGSTGADTVDLGEGEDTVDGGAGDDVIGLGQDTDGTPDGDADVVVFSDGDGNDTILDFDAPIDNGDGTYTGIDTFDVSNLTDADGNPVDTSDVVVSDDGSGNAVLTFPNGETVTLVGVAPSEVDSAPELNAIGIPCFTPGTLISTAKGLCPVETLEVGDLVLTRDAGMQRIRWAGQRLINTHQLAASPSLHPIRIKAGALGSGMPLRDVIVSPQHKMLLNDFKAELLFGESEVLVAALHLVDLPGVERIHVEDVTYVHVMFDTHQIILAEGAWTESYQPGPHVVGQMESAQREELMLIFPELRENLSAMKAARMTLKEREARVLFK